MLAQNALARTDSVLAYGQCGSRYGRWGQDGNGTDIRRDSGSGTDRLSPLQANNQSLRGFRCSGPFYVGRFLAERNYVMFG